MTEKTASNLHDRVERSVPDRFSASFRSADTRKTSLSSDLHFQSTGISNVLRDSYSSVHVGAEGESPQRCKARLERYRRTAERAANALAEKNRRDLLAQREREERNRVAEALDAEVKRWSSGKEGNLRALLSTLQYILGPDSGWQPVPLTEVITSAAVKRAYRKATLCVHPDKLQQRGATIQQKYICEKVFDLLKHMSMEFDRYERKEKREESAILLHQIVLEIDVLL
ncbi:UNVERIFIED_CONTAM: Auxilin-like protein 1 [Sesamum latifolium]|uniref:Auxilin-like protein 1 n=1 Tax=Sesamum latifolium TaxID=2727402 RepID=A0AAW2SG86_9LAMI